MSENTYDEISHDGTIIDIKDSIIYVKIIAMASCASCHAKGACSASDIEEKIVEVKEPSSHNYKNGDFVTVLLNQSAGIKAVLMGYIYPFLLILITLIITTNLIENQGVAGLISLLTLVPYYGILYLTRNKQRKTFSFRLK